MSKFQPDMFDGPFDVGDVIQHRGAMIAQTIVAIIWDGEDWFYDLSSNATPSVGPRAIRRCDNMTNYRLVDAQPPKEVDRRLMVVMDPDDGLVYRPAPPAIDSEVHLGHVVEYDDGHYEWEPA